MSVKIGPFEYRQLLSGRWAVYRGTFLMGVFSGESKADGYCKEKIKREVLPNEDT